ncbi:MAG: hypothetical protein JOZ83_09415 [Silvibacterium sp.]|nr:hypothetical protein [Silvibacterium sp.]
MQTDVKKVFYFHADANSLGGFLAEPYRDIPSQASVSLPAAGGYASVRSHDFKFEDVISCRSTYTHVAGRPVNTNGPWKARVTAVAEGINILNVLTADRVVARLFVEHPSNGGLPKLSFAGSQIHNLRFHGKQVEISLNAALLPPHHRHGDAYNEDEAFAPEIEWQALWNAARKQSAALREQPGAPAWAIDRYGWLAQKQSLDGVDTAICSLVDRLGPVDGAHSFGHFLEAPDIGRFFFAEALVMPQSIQLTLLRAELGCKTKGSATIATGRTNGSSYPP